METAKEQFVEVYQEFIHRDGSDRLLEWLEGTDFFTAPASASYHGAFEGGLVRHSVNVYSRLLEHYRREGNLESPVLEKIAICGLLHDICKTGYYTVAMRNAKNEQTGAWEKVPYYTQKDTFPYGHGEKSVWMIERFMKLTREEAMAIRWHMGAYSGERDWKSIGHAFEMYPLAMELHFADMRATHIDEVNKGDQ